MRKFIRSKSIWEIITVSFLSLFAVASFVMATTTIGTNIVTNGAIYATSTLYIDGATTFKSTVTLSAADMKFSNGYGIDVASSGTLNIGETSATLINIGSASSPVVIANASSTLANFGSGTTVAGLLFGTCAVDPQSIGAATSSLVSTSCNTGVSALTSNYKVFVSPPADEASTDNWLVFEGASASSTANGYIEITLFNASSSASIDSPSRTWSWFAIK